jgi:methylglutaconyl-CoA hydratase
VLLARCFHAIYTFPKPTLAVVHGAAMGGGNGLLAACDMAYALDDTLFSFSEVRIGIIPATISPYVIKRIGEFKAKELMLTGKRIRGQEAAQLTLINQSFKTAQTMSEYLENVIDQLKENGPNALAQCKLLIEHVSSTPEDFEQLIPYTARMIAAARLSEEGQEGMAAFLEKRKPNWIE